MQEDKDKNAVEPPVGYHTVRYPEHFLVFPLASLGQVFAKNLEHPKRI